MEYALVIAVGIVGIGFIIGVCLTDKDDDDCEF